MIRSLSVYGFFFVLERALAYALVETDAAGQLLSVGLHTPLHVVAAMAFYVVLRVVVWTTLPLALVVLSIVILRRLLRRTEVDGGARRHRRE